MNQTMKPPSGLVSILFTDIEDSARMTNALGDVFRDTLRTTHCQRVRAAIAQHRGFEVETAGDSFLIVFGRADAALDCAVAIQDGLAQPPITYAIKEGKSWTLQVRLGVHTSEEPIEPKLDNATGRISYAGYSDVNFAARVMGLGAGGQIIVSNSAYRMAGSHARYDWQEWPNRRIKSFEHPETVWELKWDGRARGEPGLRWLPAWFLGEPNRYIPRPALEARVLNLFGKPRTDGRMPRLVTIHGFGGMGKTRLAVAVALQTVGLFDGKDETGGIFFVRLEDRSPSTESLADAIGAAFGWIGDAALPASLITALRHRNCLIVLDNYETVDCDDVRRWLGRLIAETRQLRLLVTGREAVKLIDAEHVVNLEDPRNHMTTAEARELFLERVRQKFGHDWTPDERDEAAIGKVLELTDQIPLALELSAAWTGLKTLDEIAAGIAELPPGRIPSADRHCSLTRCLDWSFTLLEPPAQDAFARFSIFAGSFTAETAAKVCIVPNAQAMLYRLQDASLVQGFEFDRRMRYAFNRFTRSYAAEKLNALPEANMIRREFVWHYQAVVMEHDDIKDLRKLAVLDVEWRNAVAAAAIAAQFENWDAASALKNHLDDFMLLRGFGGSDSTYMWYEQINQQEFAVVCSGGEIQPEDVVLNNVANVHRHRGRWSEAEAAYQRNLAIRRQFDDHVGEAKTLNYLGRVYRHQGRWSKAEAAHAESLAIRRKFDDHLGYAKTLNNLGEVYRLLGRWAEAEAAHIESLAICKKLRDLHEEGNTLNCLGQVYRLQSRLSEAAEAHQRSLTICQQFRASEGEGNRLNNLGEVYRHQGLLSEAEVLHRKSLAISKRFCDLYEEANSLNNLGEVYRLQNRWPEAEATYKESLALRQRIGDHVAEAQTLQSLAQLSKAMGNLPDAITLERGAMRLFETTEDEAAKIGARENITAWEAQVKGLPPA